MNTSSLHLISEALNLKKQGNEYKGPCPVCGGHDRFWIRPGTKHSTIFGCRAGCSYSSVARNLADRGLIKHQTLDRQKVHDFKRETPLPLHLYIWSLVVLDIVANEGCEEDEIDTFITAAKYLKRAESKGIIRG